jgi:GAF domain-containing protein
MDDMTARLQDAATTLEELQGLLDEEEQLDQILDRLAETARRTIPSAVAVSVTVLTDDDRTALTASATDDTVVSIDKAQYAAGHGPCLEAARTRHPVRVGVDDIRDRWPAFAEAADAAGMRAYLSAPLLLGDDPVLGALNVYGREPDAFDPLDEALINLFTTAASAAIVNAQRYTRARRLADDLKTALVSRAEIEQAKGVLMAQRAIPADEAFQLLAHRSQNSNTKLRQVARELIAGTIHPSQHK